MSNNLKEMSEELKTALHTWFAYYDSQKHYLIKYPVLEQLYTALKKELSCGEAISCCCNCNSEAFVEKDTPFFVFCSNCKMRGPERDTVSHAIRIWNWMQDCIYTGNCVEQEKMCAELDAGI